MQFLHSCAERAHARQNDLARPTQIVCCAHYTNALRTEGVERVENASQVARAIVDDS
jgi:hypothetical protein